MYFVITKGFAYKAMRNCPISIDTSLNKLDFRNHDKIKLNIDYHNQYLAFFMK